MGAASVLHESLHTDLDTIEVRLAWLQAAGLERVRHEREIEVLGQRIDAIVDAGSKANRLKLTLTEGGLHDAR